jgi:large-conductance mechanosensitive channel
MRVFTCLHSKPAQAHETAAPPPEDITLLREIRDLLKSRA